MVSTEAVGFKPADALAAKTELLADPAWHSAIARTEQRIKKDASGAASATTAREAATALFKNPETVAQTVAAVRSEDTDIATLKQTREHLKALMPVQDEVTNSRYQQWWLKRTKWEQTGTRYLAVDHFKHGGYGDGTVTIKGEKTPIYDHGRMLRREATTPTSQEPFAYDDFAARFAVRNGLVTQDEIDTGHATSNPDSKAHFEEQKKIDLSKQRSETEQALIDKDKESDRYSAMNDLKRTIEARFEDLGLYSIS